MSGCIRCSVYSGVRRLAAVLLIPVALTSVPFASAEAPQVLARAKVSQSRFAQAFQSAGEQAPVELKLQHLKSRRFRVILPTGRSLIARQRRSKIEKQRSAGSAGIMRSTVFRGDVRVPGSGKQGRFSLSTVRSGDESGIAASFSADGRSVAIRGSANGPLMKVLDESAFPGCAGEPAPALSSHRHRHDTIRRAAIAYDGTALLDIAILFTPEMISAYGGLASAQAEAANAVASANLAYSNSEIAQELRLVYTGQASSSEGNDITTDLDRLLIPNDGYFDDVSTIRETYGADLLALFADYGPFYSYCGIGYLMTSNSINSSFADYALSVVKADCATSNLSFAHELGHNMGAAHDFANSGGEGAYSYSYGYHFTGTNASNYRSIMAYASGASGEQRVAYFSNPDVSYQGAATGTSGANNALTLNNTASVIAAFYADSGSATPAPTATPTLAPGETPTATPTPAPGSLAFSEVSSSINKKKGICKIQGALLTASENSAVAAARIKLFLKGGPKVSSRLTNSEGRFSFKGRRFTRYVLKSTGASQKGVRCR